MCNVEFQRMATLILPLVTLIAYTDVQDIIIGMNLKKK